jgi:hypothetical protein
MPANPQAQDVFQGAAASSCRERPWFGMSRSQHRTLDQLPLFADDPSIGVALFGPDRAGEWSQIASLLEARGLPKIDALMGGRYVPALRAFFDHLYGLDRSMGKAPPLAPDGVEDFEAWKKNRRS